MIDDRLRARRATHFKGCVLAFGQAWCAKMRPDFEKLLATVDVHSPARWRVNGAISATPDFATAFRCKSSAKMVPAKQCVVW